MNAKYLLLPLLLAAVHGGASAQVEIDKQQPAKPRGEVYVENQFGSVEITGWDRDVVRVTGTLAAGAEGIELDSDDESGVSIENVSVLLGHSSVRITERHYKPWVKTLQKKLEEDVRKAWA